VIEGNEALRRGMNNHSKLGQRRGKSCLSQLRILRNLSLISPILFSQTLRSSPEEKSEFFVNESTLRPGYGMCCGVRCFQASTDPGHGIQVKDQNISMM
jgi:hypothetical protein